MSGYIAQFGSLTKLNSLHKKLEYIQKIPGFEALGVVFYSKKTFLKSIGGSDFIASQSIQTEIGLEDLFELSINQFNRLGFNQTYKSNKIFKVILKNLYINEDKVGNIFLKIERNPDISYDSKIESIHYLAEHLEGFISSKYSSFKAKQQERVLSNKLLEIESLIDLTEIIYNQNDNVEGLFENILFTFISTLNASSGMIVLKDEKSGFFNVISNFNIPEQNTSRKIIRASKGIMKELNSTMSSILVDDDSKNINGKLRSGWDFVRADEYPNENYPSVETGKYAGVIGVGGLVLARIPEELAKQREAYYQQITADRNEALENDVLKEQHPSMPINQERQTRVTFGGTKK